MLILSLKKILLIHVTLITFDNITVSKDANCSVDNSNDEKECEETVMCICDEETYKNEKSYFVNKENNYSGKTCSNSIIENCVQNENLRSNIQISFVKEKYSSSNEVSKNASFQTLCLELII